jgi:hypothetical protein
MEEICSKYYIIKSVVEGLKEQKYDKGDILKL